MGDNVGDAEGKGVPGSKEFDGLPDDIEVLQDMLREAKMRLGKVRLELDVRQATLETGKGPGRRLRAADERGEGGDGGGAGGRMQALRDPARGGHGQGRLRMCFVN